MRAMAIDRVCDLGEETEPLRRVDVPKPRPGRGEILLRVSTCGVCHTELDEIEGRTPPSELPRIPGHQVVGRVAERGPEARRWAVGTRLGVAWILSACGACGRCASGAENLCADFRATGRDADGGYAEWMVVPEAFAIPIPERLSDELAAPLLCAGAIGWRSLRLAGLPKGGRLGLTGFGASAHLLLKLLRRLDPEVRVSVFARSPAQREFARELGAAWVGETADRPPELLDAIIDTTPAWKPIVEALAALRPGGRLVINAIRKEAGDQEELLRLDYARHLWMERQITSVANVTRRDVEELLDRCARHEVDPEVEVFELEEANRALLDLRHHRIRGAKVLRIGS